MNPGKKPAPFKSATLQAAVDKAGGVSALGRALGITPQQITGWRHNSPNQKNQRRICEYLGVNHWEF